MILYFTSLYSQVTQQMLRSIGTHPSRAVIGYGSNPSSPSVPSTGGPPIFHFPPQRSITIETDEAASATPSVSVNGENSSPRSSGVSYLKHF